MTLYDFLNPDGTEIEEQRMISAPGAATGDVLTVNADDTISPAPGGGSQPMLTAEVTLTNAQIKALGAGTPRQVIDAPGVGKVIAFWQGFVTIDAVAAAYGNVHATANIAFAFTGGSTASAPILESGGAISTFLGADGEVTFTPFILRTSVAGGAADSSPYDASEGENLPLGLTGDNSLGAFNGGDAANSGRIKVWYTIEDLP